MCRLGRDRRNFGRRGVACVRCHVSDSGQRNGRLNELKMWLEVIALSIPIFSIVGYFYSFLSLSSYLERTGNRWVWLGIWSDRWAVASLGVQAAVSFFAISVITVLPAMCFFVILNATNEQRLLASVREKWMKRGVSFPLLSWGIFAVINATIFFAFYYIGFAGFNLVPFLILLAIWPVVEWLAATRLLPKEQLSWWARKALSEERRFFSPLHHTFSVVWKWCVARLFMFSSLFLVATIFGAVGSVFGAISGVHKIALIVIAVIYLMSNWHLGFGVKPQTAAIAALFFLLSALMLQRDGWFIDRVMTAQGMSRKTLSVKCETKHCEDIAGISANGEGRSIQIVLSLGERLAVRGNPKENRNTKGWLNKQEFIVLSRPGKR